MLCKKTIPIIERYVNAEPVSEGSIEPVSVSCELRYAGHTLKRVFRENSIAIYARARPNREPHEFELVVIRQKPAALLPNGAIVPEREAYPSNSEWGRWAWSFPIREREFVFDLAARMAARDAPYGAWVREQVTLLYTVLREFFSEPRCEGATEVYDILDNRNSQLTHKLTSGVQSTSTYLGRIANKLDGRVTRRILRGNFVYTINWK